MKIAALFTILCFTLSAGAFAQEENMLKKYAAYNLWANQQMAEWLQTATEEQWTQVIESSFSSLRTTALHIWSAEFLWLRVLQDSSYAENPTRDYAGNSSELLESWIKASEDFYTFVAQMDEAQLKGERDNSSQQKPLSVADITQHCMNHSTYHRGQLITMGRQAGLGSPPRTDFIYYVRQ